MIYNIAEYKFRITIEDGKRMVQCDYPPYDVKTISWVKALKRDMDNIYSYCKDMFDDANRILLELSKKDATGNTLPSAIQGEDITT